MANNLRKSIGRFVAMGLALVMMLQISFAMNANAATLGTDSYEDIYKMSEIIYNNISFNEEESKLCFNSPSAIKDGLNEEVAEYLESYYSSLDKASAAALYAEIQEIKNAPQTRVVPAIVVAAAKILASAGLSWLADKLYDYGAEKFCDAFGSANAVTETVCDILT